MLSASVGHTSLVNGFLRLIDGSALCCLILLLWIPFFWLVIHPAIRFWRRAGKGAFVVVLPVWLIFAAAIILARHPLFARRVGRSALTWAVGGGLFLAAAWLDVQTRHAFGWRRLVGLAELNPRHPLHGVVRTGIYARIRHPRYLLYMLTVLAVAFLTGAPAIFLLAFLNILMYQIIVPLEERELLDQYGTQYEEYRRLVPRFVPRLGRKHEVRISS